MALFKKKKKDNKEEYYLASQWTLMRRKFLKHKLALVSLVFLAFMYFVALFGNFIAPSDLRDYDSKYMNVPPSKLHMFHDGEFVGPFVYGVNMERDPVTKRKIYTEQKDEIYKVQWFVRGTEYKFLGIFDTDLHLFGVEEGGKVFLLGADSMGRDLFSRMILGSQVSLTIPIVGTAISFLLGLLIGSISGYFGGVVDTSIQRVIEVLSSLPTIPLWMALSASIPPNIPVVENYLYITIIVSLISWTGLARIVRGKFMSLRNEDYVMAARLAGVSTGKIITKHLVPGFMSYLIVNLTLGIPSMIVGETSMSFLGLGIRSPATSWGVLLQEAQEITSLAIYPWRLIPLVAVVVTVLAFNFVGDGLRDAADPYK